MFTRKDNKWLNIDYIIVLIPLVIYGFYKNYFIVYKRGLIPFHDITNIVVVFILSILIPLSITILKNLYKKKKWYINLLNNYNIPLAIIFFLIMPVIYNKILYLLMVLIFNIVLTILPKNKFSFNLLALFQFLTIYVLKLSKTFSYESVYEATKRLYFPLFDSFFGRSIMNFGTTNISLIIFGFIYLSYCSYYKKEIPLSIIISYLISGIVFSLVLNKDIVVFIQTLIKTNLVFTSIYVASIPFFSPYTKEGSIIYGIICGILISVLSFRFNLNEIIFIIIFIVSLFNILLDKVVLNIRKKKNYENR